MTWTWLCAWWPPQDPWLALFTLLLVFVGELQWRTLQATLRSNRTIERAYVGLSHERPGVQPVGGGSPPAALVSVRVKNHGHTPATVTDLSLTLFIGSALPPGEPPYAPSGQVAAFLMAGDEFFQSLPISAAQFAQMQAGAPTYVLGYVDYRDQFGQRHRCGYARRFDARNPANNLVFVTEAGYNYEL